VNVFGRLYSGDGYPYTVTTRSALLRTEYDSHA
jgi:hypothetical protein